jgi:AraC family transcriptional regulator
MRCSDRIGEELNKWGIRVPEINQGVLEFYEELDGLQLLQLKEGLFDIGYEVLDKADSDLLDEISEIVKQLIYEKPEIDLHDYPAFVRKQLGFDDTEIMLRFSLVHGVDLIQYATIRQVERIKEMILYEGRKLGEIVELLHFKSGAQLTRTFQKITGLNPSYYNEIRNKRLEVAKRTSSGE